MATPTTFADPPDYPWGTTPDELDWLVRRSRVPDEEQMSALATLVAPSVSDPTIRRWWVRNHLAAVSPRESIRLLRSTAEIDIRPILGAVRSPALLMHRLGDRLVDVEASRYMARRIPNARLVEIPGDDHVPMFERPESILGELERFLTGRHAEPEGDRVLATILFTDIVGSTERAAELGDERWRALLDGHDAVARALVDRNRGRLIKTTGDGILATFDGPARAIRCASALRAGLRERGIAIRAGLHTGEVELRGDDVGGIAVHIASRVPLPPPRRNPRLQNGLRPGHRVRDRVRRSRRPRAEGHPGVVAAVRGPRLISAHPHLDRHRSTVDAQCGRPDLVEGAADAPPRRREGVAMTADEERLGVLHHILDGFKAHDAPAIMEWFTEDCVFDSPRGPSPFGTRLVGKEDVARGFQSRFDGIPDVHYGDDAHFVSEDRGLSESTLTGTATTGQRIEVRGCDIWTFRDGLVHRKDSFWKIVEE